MIRRTTMAVLLALALVAAACASGGTPQAEGPATMALTPTTVASSVATAHTGGDATSEGIQVHGHWTIEVRDSDGTVANRVEFENALLGEGAAMLNALLKGATSTGEWTIGLLGDHGEALTSADIVGTVFGPLELAANWAPSASTSITSVRTHTGHCIATGSYTRDDCRANVSNVLRPTLFTGTGIAPIAVQANQTVYIEVEISFS